MKINNSNDIQNTHIFRKYPQLGAILQRTYNWAQYSQLYITIGADHEAFFLEGLLVRKLIQYSK
jgi:hypothetical protein